MLQLDMFCEQTMQQKCDCSQGFISILDLAGGAYSTSPDFLTDFKRAALRRGIGEKEREGKEKEN